MPEFIDVKLESDSSLILNDCNYFTLNSVRLYLIYRVLFDLCWF